MTFDYAKNVAQSLAQGFTELSSAGIKLDSQMHDLSAVAGVTGDGLKQIETFARQSAKAFGTDAAVAVEGYGCHVVDNIGDVEESLGIRPMSERLPYG